MGREIKIRNRPIAFILANKACYQLWEEMREGCSQGRVRSWGTSGDSRLVARQPPPSALHHPTADGGAGGAGQRPAGMWGGGQEEREFAGLKWEDQQLFLTAVLNVKCHQC